MARAVVDPPPLTTLGLQELTPRSVDTGLHVLGGESVVAPGSGPVPDGATYASKAESSVPLVSTVDDQQCETGIPAANRGRRRLGNLDSAVMQACVHVSDSPITSQPYMTAGTAV